jgi:hypothetical protein
LKQKGCGGEGDVESAERLRPILLQDSGRNRCDVGEQPDPGSGLQRNIARAERVGNVLCDYGNEGCLYKVAEELQKRRVRISCRDEEHAQGMRAANGAVFHARSESAQDHESCQSGGRQAVRSVFAETHCRQFLCL